MTPVTEWLVAAISAAAERINQFDYSPGAIHIADTAFSTYDHWTIRHNVNTNCRF